MKKFSVVMLMVLTLFGVQELYANNRGNPFPDNGDDIPEAVLYSLVQKYWGYKLINAKRLPTERVESYRAVVQGKRSLLEVALSPDGGIRGEIYLDGHPDDYREGQQEVRLDRDFRQSILANGFSKKEYRRNVDHIYESDISSNRYYHGYGFYPYLYYGYPYGFYNPRYYRYYWF